MLEQNLRRGPWYQEEDEQLTNIVGLLGERRWDALAQASGLRRSGKSCRLRWMNYLRPNLKHGRISEQEEEIITQLHQQWGNKWSRIARSLPGRTDNEIKNYWRSHLRKKLQVQEQENLESVLHDGEQSLLVSNCEGVSHGDFTGEKEEISGISGESSDAFELSDFALPSSPYETRVSDWISFWSNNEESHTMKHHTDYCSVDSCSCYLEKIPVESETSMWDCSGGSIWNMD